MLKSLFQLDKKFKEQQRKIEVLEKQIQYLSEQLKDKEKQEQEKILKEENDRLLKLEQERKLIEERDNIFTKYSFDYETEESKFKTKKAKRKEEEERNEAVALQRVVFDALCDKGLENTAVEKLLDLTVADTEGIFNMKTALENKCGFILALWGILLSILLDADNEILIKIKNTINAGSTNSNYIITIILLIVLIILGLSSFILLSICVSPLNLQRYVYSEKKCNFESAVIDKNITYTALLDMNTNVRNTNAKRVDRRSKILRWAIVLVGLFALMIICCFYFL